MSHDNSGVMGFMHQQQPQQVGGYGLGDYGGNAPQMGLQLQGQLGFQQRIGQPQYGAGGGSRFSMSQMSQLGGGPQTRPTFSSQSMGTGGSNAQGRALNKMLLEILRDRVVDSNRLAMAIDANIERMDCVNLATLLFHTGKKRLLLTPSFIKRIAGKRSIDDFAGG
jgi:hypothetical protein